MNPFEMVIGIVLIVTIGSVVRAMLGVRKDHKGNEFFHRDSAGDDRLRDEIRALREEVKALKQRQAVIERITVEKEGSLEREIDRLRDE
ncbi:hypothetical protein [Allosphingosinicella sp.]|uniref:hypothetical protein n=1 Tax=Allosphingosinicella sp. TaxID=2823234 RepID=UPI0037838C3D